MRISLSLLLGVKLEMIADRRDCDLKNGPVPLGTVFHALSCIKHRGLIDRHDWVKDVFA
jgi:hypothetical protein